MSKLAELKASAERAMHRARSPGVVTMDVVRFAHATPSRDCVSSAFAVHDRLESEKLAGRLFDVVQAAPSGAIVGLEGPWGSGKTDVLRRLSARLGHPKALSRPIDIESTTFNHSSVGVVWVNPWTAGSGSVLSEFLALLDQEVEIYLSPSKGAGVKKAIISLQKWLQMTAAMAGMVGVASLFLPAVAPVAVALAATVAAGSESLKGALQSIADCVDSDIQGSHDFGVRLDRVLDQLCTAWNVDRVYLLVDDFDRCLPERQVEMLDLLFAVSSQCRRLVSVVAYDPDMLARAVAIRYQLHHQNQNTIAEVGINYCRKLLVSRVAIPNRRQGIETLFGSSLVSAFQTCSVEVTWSTIVDCSIVAFREVHEILNLNARTTERLAASLARTIREAIASNPRRLFDSDELVVLIALLVLREWDAPLLTQIMEGLKARSGLGDWYAREPAADQPGSTLQAEVSEWYRTARGRSFHRLVNAMAASAAPLRDWSNSQQLFKDLLHEA